MASTASDMLAGSSSHWESCSASTDGCNSATLDAAVSSLVLQAERSGEHSSGVASSVPASNLRACTSERSASRDGLPDGLCEVDGAGVAESSNGAHAGTNGSALGNTRGLRRCATVGHPHLHWVPLLGVEPYGEALLGMMCLRQAAGVQT